VLKPSQAISCVSVQLKTSVSEISISNISHQLMQWMTICCWYINYIWSFVIPTLMMVDFQRIIWHYFPEDRTLHNHRCENLKSYAASALLSLSYWQIFFKVCILCADSNTELGSSTGGTLVQVYLQDSLSSDIQSQHNHYIASEAFTMSAMKPSLAISDVHMKLCDESLMI
jgi:hypothetical protein